MIEIRGWDIGNYLYGSCSNMLDRGPKAKKTQNKDEVSTGLGFHFCSKCLILLPFIFSILCAFRFACAIARWHESECWILSIAQLATFRDPLLEKGSV